MSGSVINCPSCAGDGYIEVGDVDGVATASPCPITCWQYTWVDERRVVLNAGCDDGKLSLPIPMHVASEIWDDGIESSFTDFVDFSVFDEECK